MAKTVIPNDSFDLAFGYAVDTTVVSAGPIMGNVGDPPAPARIGTIVTVVSNAGMAFSTLLDVGGVQVVVSEVGTTPGGEGNPPPPDIQWFKTSSFIDPAPGTFVRTPWNPSGSLLVTRANNSVRLSYFSPVKHDLYFRTQKTTDSGAITAALDGIALGAFNLFNNGTILSEVLLQADVDSGDHTIEITAQIGGAIFVYFNGFSVLEHSPETGGEYLYIGPTGTLEDSSNNFIGDWGVTTGFAFTTATDASVFFYPQLDAGGKVAFRTQKTPDSGIIGVGINGVYPTQFIDLYADPGIAAIEIPLLDTANGDVPGEYVIELRNTGTKNGNSSGTFFYFKSTVVVFSRTDTQALKLAADYLKKTAAIRGDGAFLDSWDSIRINFDANALYACMGLLAASESLADASYLVPVKNFLTWFAGLQRLGPNPFDDGAWNIGYQVAPGGVGYVPAIQPYDAQGISEIRWVDAVQCLPAFILWWYWKLSGDNATKAALLPAFKKGIDGFIRNNYDPNTGFFFSSWQNKIAPTIFLYHDAIKRTNGGNQLELHNDADTAFFTYQGLWSSYAPQGSIGSDEHFTLSTGDYVQFHLTLNAGDQVHWITQTAWDTGIAQILTSTDGANFTPLTTVDAYTPDLELLRDFLIYTASGPETVHFRIQHSGTINPAGNIALGWLVLPSRFGAGQSDVLLGLIALWLMTRKPRYAALAARTIRRFPDKFWNEGRWLISLDGPAPGNPNNFWYPMLHGYTPFVQKQSRFFQPASLFGAGLQAIEPYQDSEGGFKPPGYLEAESIFSAFYCLGENQLAAKTNSAKYDLAKEFIKGNQFFLTLDGLQTGGILFSKRFQFLYTNISGFACLALAGAVNPFTEQLQLSQSRMVTRR